MLPNTVGVFFVLERVFSVFVYFGMQVFVFEGGDLVLIKDVGRDAASFEYFGESGTAGVI